MHKLFLTLLLFSLSFSECSAQVMPAKNSVRAGLDYMSLDAPDELGFRYTASYARHLFRDRLVLEASAGYLKQDNEQFLFRTFYFKGRPRERFTADVTAWFDVLGHPVHALRLGGGPCFWYRKDDALREATSLRDNNGGIRGVSIRNERMDEMNVGYHLKIEYEYLIGFRIPLAAQFGWAQLSRAGVSSIVGMKLGYRF